MEALSHILQPYKEIIGEVASYVTIAQFFSGVVMCKNIYKKGSTTGTPVTPFIGGIAIGILVLKYGLLLSDPAMIKVNGASIFLNTLYLLFYYKYSNDKWQEVLKPASYATALVAIFLGYVIIEEPANLEYRYGFALTVLQLLLLGSPLVDLKNIIDKKDASSIPFPLTFMATFVTFLWFIYAIILLNYFMVLQNLIGFILCIIQLALIAMYPGQGNSSETNNKKSD